MYRLRETAGKGAACTHQGLQASHGTQQHQRLARCRRKANNSGVSESSCLLTGSLLASQTQLPGCPCIILLDSFSVTPRPKPAPPPLIRTHLVTALGRVCKDGSPLQLCVWPDFQGPVVTQQNCPSLLGFLLQKPGPKTCTTMW